MNIAIPIDEFNINNVFFQEAIKNTIMDDSNFIRIIYSNDICTFNGICVEFVLHITHIDKAFNKFKYTFDNELSNNIIQSISRLEYDIISKYNIINNNNNNNNTSKKPAFRISDQIKNGIIKVLGMNNNNNNSNAQAIHKSTFMIKISGLWSNDLEYGLTYKFTQC